MRLLYCCIGVGAAILNISSNYVFIPGKAQAAYCASKSAVGSITKVAAIELAADNIRVNTVYPGFVNTPMFESVCRKFGKSNEEMLGIMARGVLLGRVGKPVDIANAVLYFASDEAQFVTGTELTVDGGEVIKRTFYDDLEKNGAGSRGEVKSRKGALSEMLLGKGAAGMRFEVVLKVKCLLPVGECKICLNLPGAEFRRVWTFPIVVLAKAVSNIFCKTGIVLSGMGKTFKHINVIEASFHNWRARA